MAWTAPKGKATRSKMKARCGPACFLDPTRLAYPGPSFSSARMRLCAAEIARRGAVELGELTVYENTVVFTESDTRIQLLESARANKNE